MANSMGADDDFFLHILHYKLSTLRNNYIIFKKKKNILTFYGCSRAHIASIILNTTCFIIIATTNSYQIRKEVFSFSINAICSSLYFAPRFRVLLLLDIIIIIRKKVSDCGCVFFIPFRVIFNLERS